MLMALPAFAKFSYEGYLTDNAGNPVVSQPVVVKLALKTVTNTCLIYEETHSSVVTDTQGYFSVVVGAGTPTLHTALSFDELFSNAATITATSPSCTAVVSPGEERNLYVTVNVAGGGDDLLGFIPVYPHAIAASSEKVGRHSTNSLLRVETAGVPATAPILTVADATELSSLVAGSSTKYVKTGAGGAGALPTSAGSTAGAIWYDSGTQKVMFHDGSAAVALGTSGSGASGITSLTGDVLATGSGGSAVSTIAPQAVSYAKIQDVTASKLLGRGSTTGPVQELTVGSGLSLSGTTLSAIDTLMGLGCGGSTVPYFNGSSWQCHNMSSLGGADSIVTTDAGGNFETYSSKTQMAQIKGATTGDVILQAPSVVSTYSLTFPANQGTNGQVMVNNGAGLLSWSTMGSGDFSTTGSSTMTGQIKGMATSSPSAPAYSFAGELGSGFYRVGAYNLGISVNSTEKMRFTSSGIGIHTGTPQSALNIHPNGGSGPAKIYMDGFGSGSTGYGGFIARQAAGVSGSPTTTNSGDILGIFGATGNFSGTYLSAPTAHVRMIAAETFNGSSGGTSMALGTTPYGSTVAQDHLIIDPMGLVGIGTAAPSAQVHILSSSAAPLIVEGTSNPTLEIKGPNDRRVYFAQTSTGAAEINVRNGSDDMSFSTGNFERLRISASGNLGINTVSPAYKLHVAGTGTVAYFQDGAASCSIIPTNAGSVTCSSDERLKRNIQSVSDALSLESILKLRTVTYEWKHKGNERHTGYVAQEVEKIAPEFINTDANGYKQVSYSAFIPWITGAIKEMYYRLSSQQDEVSRLKQENAELKARLEKIEKALNLQ